MPKNTRDDQASAFARSLKAALAANGIDLNHQKALDVVARLGGAANLHMAQAAIASATNPPIATKPSRAAIMAMVADVSWNMEEKYEFATDHGTFVWSSPAQGGDNSLVRNDNDESFQGGRDKGMHLIGDFMRDQHADLTGNDADALAAQRKDAGGHHGRIEIDADATGLLLRTEFGGDRYGNGAVRIDGRTFNVSWSTSGDGSMSLTGSDQRTRRLRIEGRIAQTGTDATGPTYSGTLSGHHLGTTLEIMGSTQKAPRGEQTFVVLTVVTSGRRKRAAEQRNDASILGAGAQGIVDEARAAGLPVTETKDEDGNTTMVAVRFGNADRRSQATIYVKGTLAEHGTRVNGGRTTHFAFISGTSKGEAFKLMTVASEPLPSGSGMLVADLVRPIGGGRLLRAVEWTPSEGNDTAIEQ